MLHTIFFLLWGQKMDLFAPHGAIKSTLWPASRKNYFSYQRVIKFILLPPAGPCCTRFFSTRGSKNEFFYLTGSNKMHFLTLWQKTWIFLPRSGRKTALFDPLVEKPIFLPLVKKKLCATRENIYFTRDILFTVKPIVVDTYGRYHQLGSVLWQQVPLCLVKQLYRPVRIFLCLLLYKKVSKSQFEK